MIGDAERQKLIATEAYLLAERRNFAPGHEVEDWLAAELEVNARLKRVHELTGKHVQLYESRETAESVG